MKMMAGGKRTKMFFFHGNENVFKEILFPLYTNPLFGLQEEGTR